LFVTHILSIGSRIRSVCYTRCGEDRGDPTDFGKSVTLGS
jgi:hypothetical protein